MADLRITDMAGSVGKERSRRCQKRTGLEVAMAGESTDGDVVAGIVDVAQVIEAADIDKNGRRRKTKLHERNQRMTASEQFRFIAVFGESAQRGIDGIGTHVFKGCGDHFAAPVDSAAQARTDFTMLW